ncbi:hypothetical protein LguiB_013357 [Lonicera macranthoides]
MTPTAAVFISSFHLSSSAFTLPLSLSLSCFVLRLLLSSTIIALSLQSLLVIEALSLSLFRGRVKERGKVECRSSEGERRGRVKVDFFLARFF